MKILVSLYFVFFTKKSYFFFPPKASLNLSKKPSSCCSSTLMPPASANARNASLCCSFRFFGVISFTLTCWSPVAPHVTSVHLFHVSGSSYLSYVMPAGIFSFTSPWIQLVLALHRPKLLVQNLKVIHSKFQEPSRSKISLSSTRKTTYKSPNGPPFSPASLDH